ncbi:MAG: SUMF1/EgtB/PvdO family nonheme iron enzyme, partial [Anaerolineales bacterium]|nr:SUMF1/EgtB/PvdO family nonheme iron enzyme [Anaerolineales bacterium]
MTHTHIPILLLAVLLLTSCTNATVAPTATSTHFPSTPAWTDTPETIIPSLAALTTTQAASNLQPPATTQAQAFTSTPKKIQPATPSIVELGDDGMQIDSHSMIFIPPGEFTMGAPVLDATIANNDEKPEHSVYLDGFWIDQLEVTN